jgi:hypothetical protein
MKIDFAAVAEAMEDNRHYTEFFLDRANGKVVQVARDVLEAVEDDDGDSIPETSTDETAVVESFIFDPKTSLITIPGLPFTELLKLMIGFYKHVSDKVLSGQLEEMTSSRNPTKRFMDILEPYPEERKRWVEYKTSFFLAEAKQWIDSLRLN